MENRYTYQKKIKIAGKNAFSSRKLKKTLFSDNHRHILLANLTNSRSFYHHKRNESWENNLLTVPRDLSRDLSDRLKGELNWNFHKQFSSFIKPSIPYKFQIYKQFQLIIFRIYVIACPKFVFFHWNSDHLRILRELEMSNSIT